MESCVTYALNHVLLAGLGFAVGAAAVAQNADSPKPGTNEKQRVAPGTPGSPIDGDIFHAQVLLDVAGFPAGVIDGKKGMSFRKAVQGFQESRGLEETGELDGPTRQALLQSGRPSTRATSPSPFPSSGS